MKFKRATVFMSAVQCIINWFGYLIFAMLLHGVKENRFGKSMECLLS